MKSPFGKAVIRFISSALLLLLVACTPDADSLPTALVPAARLRSFQFAGPGGSSCVTLERLANGQENLRGWTEALLPTHRTQHKRVGEEVALDEHGRLVYAEVTTLAATGPEVRVVLEPRNSLVHITRAGSAAIEWHVPADAPWLYFPASNQDAGLGSTPVGAWVAKRAAAAGAVVRVLLPDSQTSHLVRIDQLAVRTEHGTTVVLANDAGEVDERFVVELRRIGSGLMLSRMTEVGVLCEPEGLDFSQQDLG